MLSELTARQELGDEPTAATARSGPTCHLDRWEPARRAGPGRCRWMHGRAIPQLEQSSGLCGRLTARHGLASLELVPCGGCHWRARPRYGLRTAVGGHRSSSLHQRAVGALSPTAAEALQDTPDLSLTDCCAHIQTSLPPLPPSAAGLPPRLHAAPFPCLAILALPTTPPPNIVARASQRSRQTSPTALRARCPP